MKRIDSIQRPISRPATPTAVRRAEPTGTGARFTKLSSVKKRRHIPWSLVISVLVSPVLIGLGMLGVVGIAAVAAYGVVAFAVRFPSRNTFALALMALLYMVGVQLAANKDLAQALATLVYILLAIGAISLAREIKSASNVWFKKH